MNLKVLNDDYLLNYLFSNIQGKSKNNIKELLKQGIFVNGKLTTKFNYKLKKGDELFIVLTKFEDIDVLYEDKDIIVVNKPSCLLTVATSKEKSKTLYHMVLEYLSKKKQKVFIVHRLDRDTSGIIMFAKSEKIKNTLQNNWENQIIKRKYIAVLDGNIIKEMDTLKSFIAENSNFKVYKTNEKKGKLAITKYVKLKTNGKYSLVDIEILTGRKNQIRFQLSDIGFPIVGDNKYGGSRYDRLCLHAYNLVFKHPVSNKIMNIKTNIPSCFEKLVKEKR